MHHSRAHMRRANGQPQPRPPLSTFLQRAKFRKAAASAPLALLPSKTGLFEWRVRDRLRDDGLLMVKAAPKSNRSRDDDGESNKDTHGSIPPFPSYFRKQL